MYIKLSEYKQMSSGEKIKEVDKRSEYILSGNEIFTNLGRLFRLYKKWILKIFFCIRDSQKFKKEFLSYEIIWIKYF